MDNLHLTYREVIDIVPYRNMVLMQRDKVHTVYGEKMVEVSDEEYFKGKLQK
ncbi:MAG: hypothetical protein LBB27_01050 [Tannerellaceae bacterium]|jgi:hypothetical protein|nr:hypothetical protein [Tannerellaceae bacterium]